MLLLHLRYCAIVNPIRRHVAGLSAKPSTILIASLIWILAILLATPAALYSHVQVVQLQKNHTILFCNPFPKKFGEYTVYYRGFYSTWAPCTPCIPLPIVYDLCSNVYRLLVLGHRRQLQEGDGDVQVPGLLLYTVPRDNWILPGDGATPRTLH